MRIFNRLKYIYELDMDIKQANLEKLKLLRDRINSMLGCNEVGVKAIGVAFAAILILMGSALSFSFWMEVISGDNHEYDKYQFYFISYIVLFMVLLMTSMEYFAKGYFWGMLVFMSIDVFYIGVSLITFIVILNESDGDFKLVKSIFSLTGLAFELLALFILTREGSLGVMLRFSRNRVLKKILILERSPAKKRGR